MITYKKSIGQASLHHWHTSANRNGILSLRLLKRQSWSSDVGKCLMTHGKKVCSTFSPWTLS